MMTAQSIGVPETGRWETCRNLVHAYADVDLTVDKGRDEHQPDHRRFS